MNDEIRLITDPAKAGRLLRLATYASVITATVLIVVKLAAALMTGSVSVLASLVDSMMDVAASIINLLAVHYSLQPPDRDHRFGHGKAEPLAGLVQAAFIAGSALFLILHAVDRLLHPQLINDAVVGIGVLLFAIVASMVAWALIRNLPGLLEVLVLSRLNMRQGTSYAITTILNYAIIAIGAMTVFGALGVSWDKLQWLAAALSVGLGFGLQEIFGNFVSGLIILFERPVRIGDTVTIGTFSGTVSKIRIRATTITDFDRKEVIIPNKAFVTERLINWSLSDTVTRVVIRLGVAYGSDLDKVKEVLLKAAHDHPKVMQEPAPAVFFTTFGASTLDHELRLYVRELRDRSYTVDELNRAIDRLCRENDINIAFNQLEVHLRNEKGDEVTEVKRDGKGDDLAPTTAS